ncbi:hypothetical protein DAEQUDRAFT_731541 [Daedalea quercina L-15889]|uniref:Uncharacterized protein n=1 Tax=Daedalea quercina L-15889 TaxID=1314783 RepID=A0A165M8Z9_9APHY|nr:hypothetical protein DAEQUDRAFT_731541 [Daedalea quercina L-15889]
MSFRLNACGPSFFVLPGSYLLAGVEEALAYRTDCCAQLVSHNGKYAAFRRLVFVAWKQRRVFHSRRLQYVCDYRNIVNAAKLV